MTGLIGIKWNVKPIRAIGFVGINLNNKNYLIVKVTERKEAPGPLDGINVTITFQSGSISLVTDENGYVYVANREFESALISAGSNGLVSERNYDSSIQTNQYIEIVLSESPCLSINPFNENSFVRFHSSADLIIQNDQVGFINDLDEFEVFRGYCEGCTNEEANLFKNNYIKSNFDYEPKIVSGKIFSFIVNANLFNNQDDNYNLSLINEKSEIVQDNINIEIKDVDGSRKSIFIEDSLIGVKDFESLRFCFYNKSNLSVAYISNKVEYRNEVGGLTLISYSNSCDLDGYDYSVWEGKQNNIFIDLNKIKSVNELIIDQYKEQSSGETRTQKTQRAKIITFESYLFDEYAHDAMFSFGIHDKIFVDGKKMELKKAYDYDENRLTTTNKGVIELIDQRFSTINLHGK